MTIWWGAFDRGELGSFRLQRESEVVSIAERVGSFSFFSFFLGGWDNLTAQLSQVRIAVIVRSELVLPKKILLYSNHNYLYFLNN